MKPALGVVTRIRRTITQAITGVECAGAGLAEVSGISRGHGYRVIGSIKILGNEFSWLYSSYDEHGEVFYTLSGTSPLVLVSLFALHQNGYHSQDELVTIGPYRLRRLEFIPWRDGSLFVRDGRWWFWWALRYRVGRFARKFYSRCIATLVVWGLAEHQHGVRYSWRDIHFLRRLFNVGKDK